MTDMTDFTQPFTAPVLITVNITVDDMSYYPKPGSTLLTAKYTLIGNPPDAPEFGYVIYNSMVRRFGTLLWTSEEFGDALAELHKLVSEYERKGSHYVATWDVQEP